MKRISLILFIIIHLGIIRSDNNAGMPIIAYIGVPDWSTSEENFRIFEECGFTVSLYPYQNLDLLIKACRYAEKFGIKVIGRCPEMTDDPEKTATALATEKGFWGYFLQDEPSAPDIQLRQDEINRIKKFDNQHIFYINLFPYYQESWVEPSLKIKTYEEYLKKASATSCQQISFDHYPITTNGIRPSWYYNLEMVRKESLSSGKPFWGFVLSVPHEVPFAPGTFYPIPTIGSLRLQVYSNLAYGAQAIQYFTYWTLKSNRFNYHDAPISNDGKKTPTYLIVQQMNKELKKVSELFYGAKVISVNHIGDLPTGTTQLSNLPLNVRQIKIMSKKGAIVSQFTRNRHLYMAIVNKDHEGEMAVQLKMNNLVPRYITKQLKEELVKSSYSVPAGDILLFKLK